MLAFLQETIKNEKCLILQCFTFFFKIVAYLSFKPAIQRLKLSTITKHGFETILTDTFHLKFIDSKRISW